MKAIILSIGDELLIGQTLNTNAHWISQKMNEIGVDVIRHISLADDKEEIINCLNEALSIADIILVTGGLGPTSDDITKDVLNEYFGGQLVLNEEAFRNIETIFRLRQREITEDVRSMCYVPDNCIVIPNSLGTAPGMLFKKEKKLIISMPGVPYEMKAMVQDHFIPYLHQHSSLPVILHCNILTAGVGETTLSGRLKEFEKNKDPRIKLAYLPNVGKVCLRLTVKGEERIELETLLHAAKTEVVSAIEEYIYGYEDEQLEKKIGDLLLLKKLQLGMAESCTGGYLSHLITSIPGSSEYFKGSIISYSNEIKRSALNVQEETLDKFGAVSEETVREMLTGALDALNVGVAVAISGVAGPSGGSAVKPVGTVFIGIASRERSIVKRLSFTNHRERNIQLSAITALVMLRKFLMED